MRKQSVVLEYHAKTALLGRDAVDAPIVVPDLAFGWRNEAGDDAECGRFSTPAGPEEGNELASADFELQAVENGLAAVTLGDGHPQVADGLGHVPPYLRASHREDPPGERILVPAYPYCYFLT
jgi:hypothetical protein